MVRYKHALAAWVVSHSTRDLGRVSLGLAGLWSSAFEGGVAARIANPLRRLFPRPFQLLFPPSVEMSVKVLGAALASPLVAFGLPIVYVNKFFVLLIYSFWVTCNLLIPLVQTS